MGDNTRTVWGKFERSSPGNDLQAIEKSVDRVNSLLNPFDQQKLNKEPYFSTGARALIKVGGKSLGIAQSVRWSVQYTAAPISTIDSNFPWDFDIGQCKISAELSMIIDPTKGPENDGVFHIMSAAIHQPLVEMQIIDKKLGTSILFAKGMFVAVSGRVGVGEVSGWSAQFVGTQYQHYVNQKFNPYQGVAGAAGVLLDSLQNLSSDLTGGFL